MLKYFLYFLVLLLIDQSIKFAFVSGFVQHFDCISFTLAYNKGVAFSMFSFLEEYLKYIQILILTSGIIYLLINRKILYIYKLPILLILVGAVSNILDRFLHIGVVDYIYWHCGFDFAIFNISDILINIAIVFILYIGYKQSKIKE